MSILYCRNCKSRRLLNLFSLGKIAFTGKFPKDKKEVKKDYLNLIICNSCKLVQLDRNFNRNFLYGPNYGYRTGINKTMTEHVKHTANEACKIVKIKKGDHVLDIASNDGTLLNSYKNDIIKVGIDPILNKFASNYKKINFKINNFFSYNELKKLKLKNKFKIITALSVFYDLHDPNAFLRDVKKVLHKDGVFILEHADLLSIIKNNLFDTICHEHVEYYSSSVIFSMLKKHKLRIFNHQFNDINGGSSKYYICHQDSSFKLNSKKINKILSLEKKYSLGSVKTYVKFYKKINNIKHNLLSLLNKLTRKKMIIHGYGASTKGNVLLQYFGINNQTLKYIADKNPEKENCYTPGTQIKIVSEKFSRSLSPDYYLVLPWHFKKEIIVREKYTIKKGTKFIFPLPIITINA